jgi:hypothetical protein
VKPGKRYRIGNRIDFIHLVKDDLNLFFIGPQFFEHTERSFPFGIKSRA